MLLRDGSLVAAGEEERFNRAKHFSGFPGQSILFCLEQGKITPSDLDYIAFYDKPFTKFERLFTSYIANFPRSRSAFTKTIPGWLKEKLLVKETIRAYLGDIPVLFCEHHLSHAASAFFTSPYKESAILTVDGVGEWATTSLGYGLDETITMAKEINFPHSLGLLYSCLTSYLGFRVNDEEYKVMGLAASGTPRFKEQFDELLTVLKDGSFKLNMKYFCFDRSHNKMFNDKFERLFGRSARIQGEEIEQFHRDMAASVQAVLETVLIRLAQYAYDRYKVKNLCLAGGVALNCVANYKLLKNTPFTDIHVQPAAGDDGGALGAALFVYNQVLKNKRAFSITHAYWGPEYQDEEIENFLNNKKITYEKLSAQGVIEKTAEYICQDKIVAWFQGRMEWGPRALGNRSILANPRNPHMKDIINSAIKHREDFQPFASSIPEEHSRDWFEMSKSPFMLFAVPGKKEKLLVVRAVIHIDGTSRIQTVSPEENRLFYLLLKEMGKKTGIPLLLNTSFNGAGEPIVCTPEDAFNCFLKSGLDHLFLGSFLVSKQ